MSHAGKDITITYLHWKRKFLSPLKVILHKQEELGQKPHCALSDWAEPPQLCDGTAAESGFAVGSGQFSLSESLKKKVEASKPVLTGWYLSMEILSDKISQVSL